LGHFRFDERERPPRYPSKHHTRDYENNSKYEDDYKYPQDRFEGSAGSGKHDAHYNQGGSGGGRFDYKPSRSYHGSSSDSHRGPVSGSVMAPVPQRDRDKPLDSLSRRSYDFDPTLLPPGTELPMPVPLFELNIPPPNLDAYKESNIHFPVPTEKAGTPKPSEYDTKKVEMEKSGVEAGVEKKDSKDHRRRK